MPATHLTLELLRAVHRGVRSPADISVLALAHLLELCPRCQEVFESWRRTAGQDAEGQFVAGARLTSCEQSPEVGNLKSWIGGLLGLGEEERRELLRREPVCSHGSRVAELLLSEARGCLPGRVRDARTLASLARAVLQHGNGGRATAILYARAAAEEGNAARALGELDAAEDLLGAGRFLLHTEGCEDPLVLAELDKQEGTLRRYQGRLTEAERLLRHSASVFSKAGNVSDAARILVSFGLVRYEKHDFLGAAEVAQATLEPLERAAEASLILCARHNLAAALCEGGRIRAAQEVFDASQDLYEQETGLAWYAYRQWLDGNLRRSEGNHHLAEAALREAREAWLGQEMAYRAAVVGKDLARLYAEGRRFKDLQRLAQEILQVFEDHNAQHEADQVRQLLQGTWNLGPPVH